MYHTAMMMNKNQKEKKRMSHHEKMQVAGNTGDVVAGALAAGVVLGWVHLAVGVFTVIYTVARLWSWNEKRKVIKAETARADKEKKFYIDKLCQHYEQPSSNFDFLPVEELRRQYNEIHKAG